MENLTAWEIELLKEILAKMRNEYADEHWPKKKQSTFHDLVSKVVDGS